MAKAMNTNGGEQRGVFFVDWKEATTRSKEQKNSRTEKPNNKNQAAPAPTPSLICRLGVLADVQAADRDDAPSFSGVTRRYRDALLTARDSALSLAADAEVDFLLHLGDLVDMSEAGGRPREVLSQVLSALGESGKEQAHVLGNHCLASWPGSRGELHSVLGLFGEESRVAVEREEGAGEKGNKGENGEGGGGDGDDDAEVLVSRACPERGYYSRSFGKPRGHGNAKGTENEGGSARPLRLIALDGFDVSLTGREPGHPKRALAESLLRERNPRNEAGGWFSAEGLEGPARRFVCFNGGCGAEQLAWLRAQLEQAERAAQRVVVAVHQPLHPASANPLCLLWNYDEVLETLRPFGARGTVVATLAGHAHSDGAGVCEGGIVHRVVRGVVEHERKKGREAGGGRPARAASSSSSPCHAVVDVFDDGSVVIRGEGCDDTEHLRSK